MDLKLNQGEVTSRNSAALAEGELKQSIGCEYEPGDTDRIWKIRGRTEFGDTEQAAEVRDLVLCKFDEGGEDRLVGIAGSNIVAATPGVTGTFSNITGSPAGSRSNVADHLSAAHYLDRWYLTTGKDSNSALEPDGTIRNMGMEGPLGPPVLTVGAYTATVVRPSVHTAISGVIVDPANAYDGNRNTYSWMQNVAAGTTFTGELSGFGAGTQALRTLTLDWQFIAGERFIWRNRTPGTRWIHGPNYEDGYPTPYSAHPARFFQIRVVVEKSEDDGDNWDEILNQIYDYDRVDDRRRLQVQVDDGGTAIDSDQVRLRYSIGYIRGTTVSALRVFDARIEDGAVITPVDVGELYYACAEYDETRGLHSPLSDQSQAVSLSVGSNENGVRIDLPEAKNSNSTHWIIYRTIDGGVFPLTLGEIMRVPIGFRQELMDTFDVVAADEQALPLAPLKVIVADVGGQAEGSIAVDLNRPPPQLNHITAFSGRLVGVSGRALLYSETGLPESWPAINVVGSFSMPERDELVASVQLGRSLLVGATELMFTLDSLPDVVNGRLVASPPVPLSGQPGLVGPKALVAFSVSGESRAAWVSRFGIHVTNGTMSEPLTTDADWSAKVATSSLDSAVLAWDRVRQALIFTYETPSGGRRWALLHMAPEHRKSNGQPKCTWDHYGNISCIAAGEVGGVYRVYSGHTTNGEVYLENNGTQDKSNAYDDDGSIPMISSPGDQYAKWSEFGVDRLNVRHSDAPGETLSVDVVMSRESSGNSQSVSKSVPLAGDRGTEVFIGRAGERMSLTLTHTGLSRINLRDVRAEVEAMGTAGKVR